MFSFRNRTRQIDFGGEHTLDRLNIDYNAAYSQTHNNLGVGGGGTFTNRIAGIGWTLDRTESDLYPRFIQTVWGFGYVYVPDLAAPDDAQQPAAGGEEAP